MFKFNLQAIGAGNLKTSLSILVCVIVFELLGRSSAFLACIAAMTRMRDIAGSSYKVGKSRILGTFLGAIAGSLLTAMFSVLGIQHFTIYALLTAISATIAIFSRILFNCRGTINNACIVVFATMINLKGVGSYDYTFNRVLDTFIGVIVAIIVNRVIYPYQEKTEEKTN